MKNVCGKRKSKKAQTPYAVPIIIMSMAAFLLIYLILVYPWERAEILGDGLGEESPLGPGTVTLYSSGQIAEVGTTTGKLVFNFPLKDVSIDYEAHPKKLSEIKDFSLTAGLLSSGVKNLAANGLNLELTKEVVIRLDIAELKGTPKIVLKLNETEIYNRPAQLNVTNIVISKALLNENNPIRLEVKQSGSIFSQGVEFNSVEVIVTEYDPLNSWSREVIQIGENIPLGNTLNVQFKPIYQVTEGELLIKINNNIIWSGEPEFNTTNVASARFDESGIIVGDNEFRFEAEQGGAYTLDELEMQFIAEAAPEATKTYSFDLDAEDLQSTQDIVVGVKIQRVIDPGYLTFKIVPYNSVYYFPMDDIGAGNWVYFTLDKIKLKSLGNNILVDSPNGRYKLDGFIVILV